MTTHAQQFLQQRRFYLVLPVLVLPFITMIFWALGGGQGGQVQAQEIKSGLNLELPGAHFNKDDERWDKFSLYEQAKRDSLKREEEKRNDPYYVVATLRGINSDTIPTDENRINTSLGSNDKYGQINNDEKEINRKIELLTRQLNREETKPSRVSELNYRGTSLPVAQSSAPSQDIERLEQMMQLMNEGDSGDPEMQQIDGMLEKILDIQHPDRMKEKIKAQSREHAEQVFPVETIAASDDITLLEGQQNFVTKNTAVDSATVVRTTSSVRAERNSFFGLEEDDLEEDTTNAIEAVIHDTQTVIAGSTIKLRLCSDVFIHGQRIEKDQFIYGVCAISGERLTITINSIRDKQALFPVSLNVYDLDGLEGIYIPGAITRDVAKQASAQSIQDVPMYTMDNSLGVQAATAGIQAAKGLFSKKAKLIKITVKAGYQILLRDSNQMNQ